MSDALPNLPIPSRMSVDEFTDWFAAGLRGFLQDTSGPLSHPGDLALHAEMFGKAAFHLLDSVPLVGGYRRMHQGEQP